MVCIWNELHEKVVTAPSLNASKGQLYKHWSRHLAKFNATCCEQGQQSVIETTIEMCVYKISRHFTDVGDGILSITKIKNLKTPI